MPPNKPVWDDYIFTYTSDDDGVHIKHKVCAKEVGLPDYWMQASKAIRFIEEHANQCDRTEKES